MYSASLGAGNDRAGLGAQMANMANKRARAGGGSRGSFTNSSDGLGGSGGGGHGNITVTSDIPVKGVWDNAQIQGMKNTAKNQAAQQTAAVQQRLMQQAGGRLGSGSIANSATKAQAGLFGASQGQRQAQSIGMEAAAKNFDGETQRLGMKTQANLGFAGLANDARNREAQLQLARENQRLNELQTLGSMLGMFGGMA